MHPCTGHPQVQLLHGIRRFAILAAAPYCVEGRSAASRSVVHAPGVHAGLRTPLALTWVQGLHRGLRVVLHLGRGDILAQALLPLLRSLERPAPESVNPTCDFTSRQGAIMALLLHRRACHPLLRAELKVFHTVKNVIVVMSSDNIERVAERRHGVPMPLRRHRRLSPPLEVALSETLDPVQISVPVEASCGIDTPTHGGRCQSDPLPREAWLKAPTVFSPRKDLQRLHRVKIVVRFLVAYGLTRDPSVARHVSQAFAHGPQASN
mmetsp:Transcript_28074/g.69444  ORF Transcript_28074/g.69444 Transcript_28074/m.69444 type:complete len:265 (+) Transcript_28074:692-1486(+)